MLLFFFFLFRSRISSAFRALFRTVIKHVINLTLCGLTKPTLMEKWLMRRPERPPNLVRLKNYSDCRWHETNELSIQTD